jgi:hypothetical protein
MKPVGKPDAENPHVRFDERGWETGRRMIAAPAPVLDSTTDLVEPSFGSLKVRFGAGSTMTR